jgi:hypothetical protein
MQYIGGQLADLADAGSSTLVLRSPGGALRRVLVTVETANCTGADAAASLAVATGAAGEEVTVATVTIHATNDAQEVLATLVAALNLNIEQDTRILLTLTTAGGDTAAITGVRAQLGFGLPRWTV